MQLKIILNRVERHRSFVVDGDGQFVEDADGNIRIEVAIEACSNGRAICSGCDRKRPAYDRRPVRRLEYVPLWGIPVFFLYALRRVQCPQCGVVVEAVPWAQGKPTLTNSYRWFLAGWAKCLSWQEAALAFGTSWNKVYSSVRYAVIWGLWHRRSVTQFACRGHPGIIVRRGSTVFDRFYCRVRGYGSAEVDRRRSRLIIACS